MKIVKLTDKQAIYNRVDSVLYGWYNAMNGRFGKWVLKRKYRKPWQWITWSTFVILLFVYVFMPLMEWWQGVVDYINYVRWGIGG